MNELKQLRIKNAVTQATCAKILGVSLRSYKEYENNENKCNSLKYRYMLEMLQEHFKIAEEKGILTYEFIVKTCKKIFSEYKIKYAYLFGSYANGVATGTSDVDLLISTDETGLRFYELIEKLREQLHKKIDLINVEQLKNNTKLTDEILLTGVKIYGQH